MYRRSLSCLSLLLILSLAYAHVAQTARRPLKLDDMARFRGVDKGLHRTRVDAGTLVHGKHHEAYLAEFDFG